MSTPNPACTNGWTSPDPADPDQLHVAECGCGWSQPGFGSKTAAKDAQRAHRFPASTARTRSRTKAAI